MSLAPQSRYENTSAPPPTTDSLLVYNCFSKDIAAIRAGARQREHDPVLLDTTVEVNDRQPEPLLDLLDEHIDVARKRVAVMGLSFKPGTTISGIRVQSPLSRDYKNRG